MEHIKIIALLSIVLLMMVFPLLFFYRRKGEIRIEGDTLVMLYPLQEKKYDLKNNLKFWKVQEAYFIRWGVIYSIQMTMNNGKIIQVGSMLNRDNYNKLFRYLKSRFPERRK
jgi:hypothetical protein